MPGRVSKMGGNRSSGGAGAGVGGAPTTAAATQLTQNEARNLLLQTDREAVASISTGRPFHQGEWTRERRGVFTRTGDDGVTQRVELTSSTAYVSSGSRLRSPGQTSYETTVQLWSSHPQYPGGMGSGIMTRKSRGEGTASGLAQQRARETFAQRVAESLGVIVNETDFSRG